MLKQFPRLTYWESRGSVSMFFITVALPCLMSFYYKVILTLTTHTPREKAKPEDKTKPSLNINFLKVNIRASVSFNMILIFP